MAPATPRPALPLPAAAHPRRVLPRHGAHATEALLLGLLLGCGPVPTPLLGPAPGAPRGAGDGEAGLHVLHPYLGARLARLEAASPRFRAEMALLRRGRLPVYIGTPDQVRERTGIGELFGAGMPLQHLGDFAAVLDTTRQALVALVVRVDLEGLSEYHRSWLRRNAPLATEPRRLQARFDRLVEAVLVHEVWGHLVPIARANSPLARCPDPEHGTPAADSCVMRRENDLRRELGLRAREQYEFDLESDPVAPAAARPRARTRHRVRAAM